MSAAEELRGLSLTPGAYDRMRAALGVMHAARRQHGGGLVPLMQALESAGLLQSPETAAELERLRASAEGAHRKINEVLDYLATKDATQLSEDAGAMGFHIVAVLDGPGPRADEEVVRPVLPWTVGLTDLGVSDLVSELAEVLLDFYRPDGPIDVELLVRVEQVLATHRDRLARELGQDAAGAGERS